MIRVCKCRLLVLCTNVTLYWALTVGKLCEGGRGRGGGGTQELCSFHSFALKRETSEMAVRETLREFGREI